MRRHWDEFRCIWYEIEAIERAIRDAGDIRDRDFVGWMHNENPMESACGKCWVCDSDRTTEQATIDAVLSFVEI
jgi:hypothetical protein